MIIKTNSHDIAVSSVVSTTIRKDGKTYPALKFVFDGAVTAEDIAALTSGNIEVDGNAHEGYTTLSEIAVSVGKITTAEAERDRFESELSEVRENVNSILPLLDDEQAVTVKMLYPVWGIGKNLEAGERVLYEDNLYKVLQGHYAQEYYAPDVAPSLFTRIDETHAGTLEDPIPYDGNMVLENGKYYTQDGEEYVCIRDSENAVYHALSELVGTYVEHA